MTKRTLGQLTRYSVLGLAVSALSACTLVPGSHISGGSDSASWFGDGSTSAAESTELPDLLRIHEITPSLRIAPVTEQAALPQELLQAEASGYDYIIGPGDVLNITVWDHPELTIPAGGERSAAEAGNWVHADGSIFYPYVGNVTVAGRNVRQVRAIITERLTKYIENPQVDVSVAAFRSQKVYVAGAVKQPGALPLTNVPMRLLDAVNQAGGVDETADWRSIVLTRNGREYTLSLKDLYERGDARYNVLLQPGDVLHVSRGDDAKVFVLGEVLDPKPLFMGRNGLTLAEALAEAKGLNELQADASGVFVMRRTVEGDERYIDLYQLNARDATALILADEFVLEPRDVVYVTAAPLARWNRVIGQLMPTVQTLYYGALGADRVRNLDD